MEMPATFTIASLWLALASTTSFGQLVDKAAFYHTCDASASVALSGRLFAVASDEDNWLRIYDVREPGPPVQLVNLTHLLGFASEEEMDIEGATRIGRTSYWITSHGAKSNGKAALSRQVLFALDIKVSDGRVRYAVVGHPYIWLLRDLSKAPALAQFDFQAASHKAPKEEGAINIEGLCAVGDKLLIGFRNPVPGGKAILLPLTNPRAILGQSADESLNAEFGEPMLLDLGGRGVRSIEYDVHMEAFWIVAGQFDAERDFALFRWSGPGHEPEDMDVDFRKWNPEALITWRKNNLQILSDDGERTIDDVDEEQACKDLPIEARQFRSGWIELQD